MQSGSEQSPSGYTPTFFTAAEWAFLHAACDRLIPSDALGPGALDLNVPEFLDRHMQTPYAAGDMWYRKGPFFDAPPEFGYQGGLSLRELLRAGIAATDRHCRQAHDGRSFAELAPDEQDALLAALERGAVALDGVPSKSFFTYLLAEVRAGYFSDPVHGGNRDKGAWKMIGYPGMAADYREWIGVRDRPYGGSANLDERGEPS